MHQRQLRLGDILDDYCPRERRLTNHVVVAMVDADVKRTRCTTCDTEHEYKHAKVPRQRRKTETPAALYSQVLANGPKRVAHEPGSHALDAQPDDTEQAQPPADAAAPPGARTEEPVRSIVEEPPASDEPLAAAGDSGESSDLADEDEDTDRDDAVEEGPVHRPLIRATLPRPEGQPPPARPAPDFTVRQPGGRANRFRPRHQRGPFQGNRNGNMAGGGGPMRSGSGRPMGGGRPPQGVSSRPARHHGPRKRSK